MSVAHAADVDLTDFCRVCLKLPPESQVLDLNLIYDEEEQLTYSDCFVICARIDLMAGADMPHNLCKSCGLELQVAYDFHKKVEASKQFLNQVKCAQLEGEEFAAVTVRDEEEDDAEQLALGDNSVETISDDHIPKLEVEVEEVCLVETTIDECEELEEHLEIEDYQTMESLEDDDAETIQSQMHVHHSSPSDGDEYLIEKLTLSDGEQEQFKIDVSSANIELYLDAEPDDTSCLTENSQKSATSSKKKHPNGASGRRRHPGEYSCDHCHKLFPNHSRMAAHRRCHEHNRPKFPCTECGRPYATKQAMEVHVRTTHTKTGYPCPQCGKIYAIKKGLEVHMRYHTGDFPYVCDLCGKKFAQMCHLNTHTKVKHNSVRFSCEHPGCSKFFTSSASLRNHEFSHGKMPFECAYCRRGYPAKAKLKVHIRRKHGVELTLEDLEQMRKFHVMRSKLHLVKVEQCED